MARPGTRLVLASLAVVMGLGAAGCPRAPLYYWGRYEASLYSRYVREDLARSEAFLRDTIVAAEQTGNRVPPGAYADYGFLLYRRNDFDGAVGFFVKEWVAFPESAALMSKIVERVRQQQKKATESGGEEAQHPETVQP